MQDDDDLLERIRRVGLHQARLVALQAKLPSMVETGTAAGGKVAVKVNGRGELLAVEIDPTLLDPSQGAELEALILSAARLARTRVDQSIDQELGKPADPTTGQ
jgi:DNA-binding YbaB/EbfC family protein